MHKYLNEIKNMINFLFFFVKQAHISDGEMNRSRCVMCRYEISQRKQSQAEMRREPEAHLGKKALFTPDTPLES